MQRDDLIRWKGRDEQLKSAYILPHPPIAWHDIGRGEEYKIQKTIDGCRKVAGMVAREKPETIVLISPHNVVFEDAFYINPGCSESDDLLQFGSAASVTYNYDVELRNEILRLCNERKIPTTADEIYAGRHDHGSVLPLLFVNEKYSGYKVLRIAPSFLPNEDLLEMGRVIERAAAHAGRNITIIASGDLSHKLLNEGPYGFAPEGPEFDRKITGAMKAGDLDAFCKFDKGFLKAAAECGLPGFIMMAGALSGYNIKPEFISYEGTFGVGYAVCAFECVDRCVELASDSIQNFVKTGCRLKRPDNLPPGLLDRRAGVFVSIHKKGNLRGCIGTINASTGCVADEIMEMAVEAAVGDPRFIPVNEDELTDLEINVDVLSDAEPATMEELDVKRYGVIVSCGGKRGLLLPDLEGIDTPRQQVDIALMKAGIASSEPYKIARFTVERHR